MSGVEDLKRQRDELDEQIADAERQEPPGWARYLFERLDCGQMSDAPGRIDFSPECRARLGPGAPHYLYAVSHFVTVGGESGSGMLAVLRALVALEEARARGEIVDELVADQPEEGPI